MKKSFLFLCLVLAVLGVWWYFSRESAVLDYSVVNSVETPAEVALALDSIDAIDLDKELGSLDADINGL